MDSERKETPSPRKPKPMYISPNFTNINQKMQQISDEFSEKKDPTKLIQLKEELEAMQAEIVTNTGAKNLSLKDTINKIRYRVINHQAKELIDEFSRQGEPKDDTKLISYQKELEQIQDLVLTSTINKIKYALNPIPGNTPPPSPGPSPIPSILTRSTFSIPEESNSTFHIPSQYAVSTVRRSMTPTSNSRGLEPFSPKGPPLTSHQRPLSPFIRPISPLERPRSAFDVFPHGPTSPTKTLLQHTATTPYPGQRPRSGTSTYPHNDLYNTPKKTLISPSQTRYNPTSPSSQLHTTFTFPSPSPTTTRAPLRSSYSADQLPPKAQTNSTSPPIPDKLPENILSFSRTQSSRDSAPTPSSQGCTRAVRASSDSALLSDAAKTTIIPSKDFPTSETTTPRASPQTLQLENKDPSLGPSGRISRNSNRSTSSDEFSATFPPNSQPDSSPRPMPPKSPSPGTVLQTLRTGDHDATPVKPLPDDTPPTSPPPQNAMISQVSEGDSPNSPIATLSHQPTEEKQGTNPQTPLLEPTLNSSSEEPKTTTTTATEFQRPHSPGRDWSCYNFFQHYKRPLLSLAMVGTAAALSVIVYEIIAYCNRLEECRKFFTQGLTAGLTKPQVHIPIETMVGLVLIAALIFYCRRKNSAKDEATAGAERGRESLLPQ